MADSEDLDLDRADWLLADERQRLVGVDDGEVGVVQRRRAAAATNALRNVEQQGPETADSTSLLKRTVLEAGGNSS